MFKPFKLLLIGFTLVPALALSHGPARVKVVQDIEVNASPEEVWSIVKGACSIKDWNSAVTDCKTDGEGAGARRELTLENGETIKIKFSKFDEENKRILSTLELEQGRIIKGMPIATLGTFLTITESESGSKVELKGAFYRAFPGQQPPADMTDEACKEAVLALYNSGLEGIKQLAEGAK